jgi:hypothetical protein
VAVAPGALVGALAASMAFRLAWYVGGHAVGVSPTVGGAGMLGSAVSGALLGWCLPWIAHAIAPGHKARAALGGAAAGLLGAGGMLAAAGGSLHVAEAIGVAAGAILGAALLGRTKTP